MTGGQADRRTGGQGARVRGCVAFLLLSACPAVRLSALQCPDGTPPPCRGGARTPAPTSVAVLYFENRSRDSADAYLAEGLTEQTIAQLGEVQRLTVASRFAVRRFRGEAAQDPAAIGRSLNVSYLVTGSVQRAGTRLRVGVELLRASSGVRVWGEQYDRTETDLLRLQDDIAANVATGIVGRLLPDERRAVTARTTRNPAAYDHLLRGNFQLARRDPQAIQLALREYQAASRLDPGYTDAVARNAYAYANALDNEYDIGLPADTMVARGQALAEQALRLDSLSSDAWLASAYMAMGRDPVAAQGARERYERAIALDPRSAEARHQYGFYLSMMGDSVGAFRENVRALELEPGRAITWYALSTMSLKAGRPREALRFADSSIAADPDFTLGYLSRFVVGMYLRDTTLMGAAVADLSARPANRGMAVFLRGVVMALAGDSAVVRALRGGMPAALQRPPTAPGNVNGGADAASLFALLDDKETSLQLLEGLYPRGLRLHDALRYPAFDGLRSEPRFIQLFNATRAPGSAW